MKRDGKTADGLNGGRHKYNNLNMKVVAKL